MSEKRHKIMWKDYIENYDKCIDIQKSITITGEKTVDYIKPMKNSDNIYNNGI